MGERSISSILLHDWVTWLDVICNIDVATRNGYVKEEMKITNNGLIVHSSLHKINTLRGYKINAPKMLKGILLIKQSNTKM